MIDLKEALKKPKQFTTLVNASIALDGAAEPLIADLRNEAPKIKTFVDAFHAWKDAWKEFSS